MAKTQEEKPKAEPAEAVIGDEERVDDFAVGQFQAMGHTSPLPESTVAVYKEFKLRKDRMTPGRLSAEGFVFVDILSDIVDGRLVLPGAGNKTKAAASKSEE